MKKQALPPHTPLAPKLLSKANSQWLVIYLESEVARLRKVEQGIINAKFGYQQEKNEVSFMRERGRLGIGIEGDRREMKMLKELEQKESEADIKLDAIQPKIAKLIEIIDELTN